MEIPSTPRQNSNDIAGVSANWKLYWKASLLIIRASHRQRDIKKEIADLIRAYLYWNFSFHVDPLKSIIKDISGNLSTLRRGSIKESNLI